jgi:transcriptional regulator with XRE-family HTH domain
MLPRLGRCLVDARATRGRSLQAVASAARISTGYLHKLEAGRVGSPSPRVLHRLADVLGVPYWTLMELADYLVPPPPGGPHAQPQEVPMPPAAAQPAAEPSAATNRELAHQLAAIRDDLARLQAHQDELARLVERALARDPA